MATTGVGQQDENRYEVNNSGNLNRIVIMKKYAFRDAFLIES